MLTASLFVWTVITVTQAAAFPVTGYIPESSTTQGYDGDHFIGFTCPGGWTMHSIQCLHYNPQNMTWDEAKRHCESMGQGSLASVYDDMLAEEIHQELTHAGHQHGPVWVGGYKSPRNPSWSWSDYVGFNQFADFCQGDSAHHENDCLQIVFDENESGCLDDRKCDMKLPSICGMILI
ncbi:type-2 ice-structuring protein-like [Kryptolebias marmoratus]|uniref:type-2 ice-structuring protein-like n=1 Tax=Kryptolebias marmoratus TaxID=37003 RepID=UPI0007F92DEA|nr:type-2 ice-structuring protein-like [Kryptolebias marmoratus]